MYLFRCGLFLSSLSKFMYKFEEFMCFLNPLQVFSVGSWHSKKKLLFTKHNLMLLKNFIDNIRLLLYYFNSKITSTVSLGSTIYDGWSCLVNEKSIAFYLVKNSTLLANSNITSINSSNLPIPLANQKGPTRAPRMVNS